MNKTRAVPQLSDTALSVYTLATEEKYAIQPEGAEITYLAGLYRFEKHRGVQMPMFAVIT